MANNYLTSSFILDMTADDAEMVRLAQRASEIVADFASDTPRDLEYDNLGSRFAALLPPMGDDDFGSFLDLFDDPDFPTFDCSIVISDADAEGHCQVSFTGNQFGVDQAADYGWFMHVCDDVGITEAEAVPTEIRSAIHVAKREDCAWIMWDCDGPQLDELPEYEWGDVPDTSP